MSDVEFDIGAVKIPNLFHGSADLRDALRAYYISPTIFLMGAMALPECDELDGKVSAALECLTKAVAKAIAEATQAAAVQRSGAAAPQAETGASIAPSEASYALYGGETITQGPLKRIWIDRDSAARGGPAWIVQVRLPMSHAETTFAVSAWSTPGVCFSRGGMGDAMLTPKGPAFWIETNARVDIVG
jgi:hypothetical protein